VAEAQRAAREARSAHDTRELLKWGGIALLLASIALGVYAWREAKVSQGASAQPVRGDLAQIEKTGVAPDLHLELGRHLAIYPSAVFEYELDRWESEPAVVPGETEINDCIYPVISERHPVLAALEAWSERRSEGETADEPTLEKVAVLVKTERFGTVGAIPDDSRWEAGVRGLVINRVRSLKPDESRLIRESLPGVDLSRVLILEEGRTPTSGRGSVALFLLAALVAAGGVVCLSFWRRLEAAERMRRYRAAREELPEELAEELPPEGRRSAGRRPRRRR
jgi:hypothetical protein